jgi:hypothetical protein
MAKDCRTSIRRNVVPCRGQGVDGKCLNSNSNFEVKILQFFRSACHSKCKNRPKYGVYFRLSASMKRCYLCSMIDMTQNFCTKENLVTVRQGHPFSTWMRHDVIFMCRPYCPAKQVRELNPFTSDWTISIN